MATVTIERSWDWKGTLEWWEKHKVGGGGDKADVCREFGPVNSTIQMIRENRKKNITAFDQNG
jgi:hypothetical protein